jgi:hypothetical protein
MLSRWRPRPVTHYEVAKAALLAGKDFVDCIMKNQTPSTTAPPV